MGHMHQAWSSCMTAAWSICLFHLNFHCGAVAEKELGRKAIPLLRESLTVCFNKYGETTEKKKKKGEVLLLNTRELRPYIRTFSWSESTSRELGALQWEQVSGGMYQSGVGNNRTTTERGSACPDPVRATALTAFSRNAIWKCTGKLLAWAKMKTVTYQVKIKAPGAATKREWGKKSTNVATGVMKRRSRWW